MGFPCIIHEVPPPTCGVVGSQECKAPANSDKTTKASCFACGLSVCTDKGCSRTVSYLTYGRKRICTNCLISQLDWTDQKIFESARK